MQKSIEKVMHLGIDFWKDFGEFLNENSKHVGIKIKQKSMPTSKSDCLKKPRFSNGKTMILRVQGIEVGSKNQRKIDKKMESRWEGILESIFNRFWWIFERKLGWKMKPRENCRAPEKTLKN